MFPEDQVVFFTALFGLSFFVSFFWQWRQKCSIHFCELNLNAIATFSPRIFTIKSQANRFFYNGLTCDKTQYEKI